MSELYGLIDDEIRIVEEATQRSVPRPSGSGPSTSESARCAAKGRSLTLAVLMGAATTGANGRIIHPSDRSMPTDKGPMQRQSDATDRRIDQLVYVLYELTNDEIKIIEEATAS